jgi:hypothetical protein
MDLLRCRESLTIDSQTFLQFVIASETFYQLFKKSSVKYVRLVYEFQWEKSSSAEMLLTM